MKHFNEFIIEKLKMQKQIDNDETLSTRTFEADGWEPYNSIGMFPYIYKKELIKNEVNVFVYQKQPNYFVFNFRFADENNSLIKYKHSKFGYSSIYSSYVDNYDLIKTYGDMVAFFEWFENQWATRRKIFEW